MENHPIPQDVTGFKFKLIGSVTLKQFLYILGGGIMAVICFVLPTSAFIRIPFAVIFGGIGTALAFIPIEGRPMDIMLKNFLRALPNENQYIFKKRGATALINEFFTPQTITSIKVEEDKKDENDNLDKKRALLYQTLRGSYRPDEKEKVALSSINSYLVENHSASPPVQNADKHHDTPPMLQIVPPPPIQKIIAKKTDFAPIGTAPIDAPPQMDRLPSVKPLPLNTSPLYKPTPQQPQKPEQQKATQAQPTPNAQELSKAIQTLKGEVSPQEKPTDNSIAIKNQTSIPKTEVPFAKPAPKMQDAEKVEQPSQNTPTDKLITPSVPLTTIKASFDKTEIKQAKNVSEIAPEASFKAGFPSLPDAPNIVLGIVKDPRGKVLPNILVEIMSTENVPVRAFKTNALGQFSAATPLPNGEYNVILEDPRKLNEFEKIRIKLDGKIFNPLEINSVDQREKLRRELFGSTQQMPATGI